jgi:hypothetical protein
VAFTASICSLCVYAVPCPAGAVTPTLLLGRACCVGALHPLLQGLGCRLALRWRWSVFRVGALVRTLCPSWCLAPFALFGASRPSCAACRHCSCSCLLQGFGAVCGSLAHSLNALLVASPCSESQPALRLHLCVYAASCPEAALVFRWRRCFCAGASLCVPSLNAGWQLMHQRPTLGCQ